MKKKKILYVITKSNFGGAQRYVYDLATSLPVERFDVGVVLGLPAPRSSRQAGGEGVLAENLNSKGIRVIALPYFGRDIHIWNDVKTFFTLIKIFRAEKPDVIHLNSSKAGILGSIAGKITRVPKIIFTTHGWAFNEERPLWQKFFFFIIHFKTVLFAHITIAVSEQTKKQITWMPFIEKKIFVIHNGIKPGNVKTRAEARGFMCSKLAPLQEKMEGFWIGTIAELHKTKGLIYAIAAIKDLVSQFPNVVYIIIGNGEERKNIEKAIEKYNMQRNIFLAGFLPNAASYMRAFDIFLVPSVSEALSYAVLEAGICQLPVIATAVGGIPEIIENKKNGLLIPPRNTKALFNALIDMVGHEKQRDEYGKRLSHTIQSKFSLDQMVQKTIAYYR